MRPVFWLGLLSLLQSPPGADSTIEAIRFGTIPSFPVSGLVVGAPADERMDVALVVWLIRGGGRAVLFDSGFHRQPWIDRFKVTDFARPDEAVRLAGLDAITDVVISHAHWDHLGGIDLFPNATVWIQKAEFEYYTGAAWQEDGRKGGIDVEDLVALVRRNATGKLRLVDGDDPRDPARPPGLHRRAPHVRLAVPARGGRAALRARLRQLLPVPQPRHALPRGDVHARRPARQPLGVRADDRARGGEGARCPRARPAPVPALSVEGAGGPDPLMKAPERIETERLVLRRPAPADAPAIFTRYASDPEVTRFLGWPRHRGVDETRAFLEISDQEWERWPAGPYVLESRESGGLLGGSGFGFETAERASTGYVLARDAWGQGYATEALRAVVATSAGLGVKTLYALCHAEHVASRRVLEKCGFTRAGTRPIEFPNLGMPGPSEAFCYTLSFD